MRKLALLALLLLCGCECLTDKGCPAGTWTGPNVRAQTVSVSTPVIEPHH